MKYSVPLLSWNDLKGNSSVRGKFTKDFFNALKECGFIRLKDHLVSEELLYESYELYKEFFSLPFVEKEKLILPNGKGQRGYTPFGTEHAKGSKHPDLKEFFHVGREFPPFHKDCDYYPKNIWPKNERFKEVNLQLYQSLDLMGQQILNVLCQVLDLPQSYFREMVSMGNSILRAIHYPPITEEMPKNSVRAEAHTDINLITLLVSASASGLEILYKNKTWIPVEAHASEIIVDAGDMLSRITNDLIPSTIHRVINPKDCNSSRYSLPFFLHPHKNAMLECIPSCIGKGEKYPPILANDFLMERLREIGL